MGEKTFHRESLSICLKKNSYEGVKGATQPSECGRQRTLNNVHAQTAAQQQSNRSYEARMSGKCGEWRE